MVGGAVVVPVGAGAVEVPVGIGGAPVGAGAVVPVGAGGVAVLVGAAVPLGGVVGAVPAAPVPVGPGSAAAPAAPWAPDDEEASEPQPHARETARSDIALRTMGMRPILMAGGHASQAVSARRSGFFEFPLVTSAPEDRQS
jgi:hypothetical protein